MNVCGGHERAISMAGLRGVLPACIELIPGPGCPVCICPEEDIFDAIQLALRESITMAAFGDMLRVPVNVAKGEIRSLEQAKAAGADIRPIASPVEVVKLATSNPKRNVVFFAAGFTPESLLAAFYSVLRQRIEGRVFLDNCYPEVVNRSGNAKAKQIINRVMKVSDANWRGVGIIPKSGFELQGEYKRQDARLRFPADPSDTKRKHIGEMPPGCDCARVVLGKLCPSQCRLYAKACTPRNPIGPCMVSDEGACRIWWSGGVRQPSLAHISHPPS